MMQAGAEELVKYVHVHLISLMWLEDVIASSVLVNQVQ